jgi:hypothetical protein
MAKMAGTREHHGDVALVRSGNDLFIAHGATGLDGGSCPGLRRRDQAISKREEGVTTDHATLEREARLARFPDGNATGIDTAHLARSDSKRAIFADVHDGVALEMFDDLPSKQHGALFRIGWGSFGCLLQIVRGGGLHIPFLPEKGFRTNGPQIPWRGGLRVLKKFDEAQVLLGLQNFERLGSESGSDDHFTEDLANVFGALRIQRLVYGYDSTEGRLLVSRKCLLPCACEISALTDSARIGVFQDGKGGGLTFEFGDQVCRCGQVENVVVGKCLAVQLAVVVFEASVKSGGLVGVFAIT